MPSSAERGRAAPAAAGPGPGEAARARPADGPTFAELAGVAPEEVVGLYAMVGKPLRIRQWNHEATYDTIRHWCAGIGDDNPLWTDEAYAAQGPYGAIVAPPSFLFSVFGPTIRPGLPGVPSVQGGGRLAVTRYVRRGERILAEAKLVALEEKNSARAGRVLIQTGETVYRTADGEIVGSYLSRGFRVPRPGAPGRPPMYAPRPPHRYSPQELARLRRQVLAQARRGAAPVRWHEVSVGDRVPERVKGPLDAATMAAFYAGNGPGTYLPADLRWKLERRAALDPASMPDNAPPPGQPTADAGASGSGHDDPEAARAAGMPGAFDVGWQRISWMLQALTDWAGDHGRVRCIDVRLGQPNVAGDTVWCGATVTGKRMLETGEIAVDLDVFARRHDGTISATGTAQVALAQPDDHGPGAAAATGSRT
jgi:acyl dehydratase